MRRKYMQGRAFASLPAGHSVTCLSTWEGLILWEVSTSLPGPPWCIVRRTERWVAGFCISGWRLKDLCAATSGVCSCGLSWPRLISGTGLGADFPTSASGCKLMLSCSAALTLSTAFCKRTVVDAKRIEGVSKEKHVCYQESLSHETYR